MNIDAIKIRIKIHEGYRDTVYEDSLGKATIGYGHLVTYKDKFEEGVKYPKDELEKLFDKDFDNAKEGMEFFIKANELDISDSAKEVLIEMIFQLGIGNVNKFKGMLHKINSTNAKLA